MAVDPTNPTAPSLPTDTAEKYAAWFACLADPTRLRLLHLLATGTPAPTVGELASRLAIGQPTVSHHLRKLSTAECVTLTKDGTATRVSINADCAAELPHVIDVLTGLLATTPCCPTDLPADVTIRPMISADFDTVRAIYAEGIATGNATFETEPPDVATLERKWLPDHRWVAEIADVVVGWAAATPTSSRACYAGVAETSIYIAGDVQGRGVGKALIHQQVTAADKGGLWTLQTSIFPENKASLALHRSAGFRTVGVRERIARHHGRWRDTIVMERRSTITDEAIDPSAD
ncbi:metalloregulator ArsR/SmtB family transcription factor [Spiractinospora alimapuensis]|uniref:helix-turn-helix domain-containing GNAT family N-acetyltransferase n=1 Tax=Spiractinospora alimapuensis TaxID=2820884 RepID=UPI001F251BC4|nr:metalloregulator ArsR/SmtB family transcription factor [Spiractinospora alimapuensis]QVQ52858.1 metalloregulator ArsR/SmtB family transcription factor [Spiractinospora alimapuensis]